LGRVMDGTRACSGYHPGLAWVVSTYGNEWSEEACSSGPPEGELQPADKSTQCRGSAAPFDEISDLSGNAAEWTAAQGSQAGVDVYALRGNWTADPAREATRCDRLGWDNPQSILQPFTGIRRCQD